MRPRRRIRRFPGSSRWPFAADRPYLIAALLHSNLTPEATFEDLEHIGRRAQPRPAHVWRVSACPLNFEFTLHEPYVFEGLDAWQPLMKMDEPEVKKALGDAGFRRRLKDELEKRSRRMFTGEWKKAFVAQVADPAHASLGGAIDRGSGEKAGGASGGLHPPTASSSELAALAA